jgi:Flp pilus assembly pilin Flp
MRGSVGNGSAWWRQGSAESGQTMAEYATLLSILVIGVVVVIGAFTTGVADKLQSDLITILAGT